MTGDHLRVPEPSVGLGVTLHEALTGQPCVDQALPAGARPAPPVLPETGLHELIVAMLAPEPAAPGGRVRRRLTPAPG